VEGADIKKRRKTEKEQDTKDGNQDDKNQESRVMTSDEVGCCFFSLILASQYRGLV
jgi:hypothetical protein